MTQLLERAIVAVQRLPDAQQDALATLLLEEIADDEHWDEQFAQSQDKLARLAAKAREDVQAARVATVGIDEL